MPRLRESPDEFLGLVAATAEATGMPQPFVEKDYWVTELLRSMAKPIEYAIPIFKGGTSLSKVYRLVERFSEDVDILVQFTPPSGETFGEARRDRFLKTLCDRVLLDLQLGEAGRGEGSSDRGKRRSQQYIYPALRSSTVVKPGVLLEIGIRGEPFPRTSRAVRSYMAEYAIERAGAVESDFDEFASVEISVLHSERTLVEKLAMVHGVAMRYPGSAGRIEQTARHLYDIARLLADGEVRATLESSPAAVVEMAERTDRISEAFGWSFSPRPAGGYGSSPAFDPAHPVHAVLRPAYARVLNSLVYGARPTYDECLATVRRYGMLI